MGLADSTVDEREEILMNGFEDCGRELNSLSSYLKQQPPPCQTLSRERLCHWDIEITGSVRTGFFVTLAEDTA